MLTRRQIQVEDRIQFAIAETLRDLAYSEAIRSAAVRGVSKAFMRPPQNLRDDVQRQARDALLELAAFYEGKKVES